MDREPLRVGSLFAGIGGIDLGLERAGMHVAFQCEIDPWCRGILARHWPDVPCFGDIRSIGAADVPRIDVLAGGFPCQPVSLAGKGLAQDDARWLWPEFARLVRVLRPRYVIAENVPGILTRGLGIVLADLAALGFDADWTVFGARDVGAPHRRDRVWIVGRDRLADADGESARRPGEGKSSAWRWADPAGRGARVVADADGERPSTARHDAGESEDAEPVDSRPPARLADADRERFEGRSGRQPRRRSEPADSSGAWRTEPDVGRVAHGVPARVDRLRSLGNAVVPACAEHIGRIVIAHHASGGAS